VRRRGPSASPRGRSTSIYIFPDRQENRQPISTPSPVGAAGLGRPARGKSRPAADPAPWRRRHPGLFRRRDLDPAQDHRHDPRACGSTRKPSARGSISGCMARRCTVH